MTLTATLFRGGRLQPHAVALADCARLLREPDVFLWVDAVRPTPAEIAGLQEEFGLHPLAIEDALNAHQRPKIDRYDTYAFVVAYGAAVAENHVQLHELGLFLAKNYVITIRHDPVHDIAELRVRLERAAAELGQGGALFAYVILDHLVDGYFEVVAFLQDRIQQIEEQLVWRSGTESAGFPLAYAVRRDVVYFRRVVAPLREVLNAIVRRDEDLFGHELDEYFRDLYDHIIRVHEELDTARELLAAALEDHLSVVSNRLNEVVLKVSAWAAIIALPTVIASIYGMNFDHMPELHWLFGYPFALALMVGSASALYVAFKRRKWL